MHYNDADSIQRYRFIFIDKVLKKEDIRERLSLICCTDQIFFYIVAETLYRKMKKLPILLSCLAFVVFTSVKAQTQTVPKKTKESTAVKPALEEEEEGPALLKFEPDFMNSVAERREYIRRTRAILDTLDIPERRRRKLLRDLHKNGLTKRLSKALVAETEFEDEIEE